MSIKIRERDVESYLTIQLNKLHLPCIKFIPDGKTGMPDRLVVLPNRRGLWVEHKISGVLMEEIQKRQHKRFSVHGYRVVVLWGKDDFDNLEEELTNAVAVGGDWEGI